MVIHGWDLPAMVRKAGCLDLDYAGIGSSRNASGNGFRIILYR